MDVQLLAPLIPQPLPSKGSGGSCNSLPNKWSPHSTVDLKGTWTCVHSGVHWLWSPHLLTSPRARRPDASQVPLPAALTPCTHLPKDLGLSCSHLGHFCVLPGPLTQRPDKSSKGAEHRALWRKQQGHLSPHCDLQACHKLCIYRSNIRPEGKLAQGRPTPGCSPLAAWFLQSSPPSPPPLFSLKYEGVSCSEYSLCIS